MAFNIFKRLFGKKQRKIKEQPLWIPKELPANELPGEPEYIENLKKESSKYIQQYGRPLRIIRKMSIAHYQDTGLTAEALNDLFSIQDDTVFFKDVAFIQGTQPSRFRIRYANIIEVRLHNRGTILEMLGNQPGNLGERKAILQDVLEIVYQPAGGDTETAGEGIKSEDGQTVTYVVEGKYARLIQDELGRRANRQTHPAAIANLNRLQEECNKYMDRLGKPLSVVHPHDDYATSGDEENFFVVGTDSAFFEDTALIPGAKLFGCRKLDNLEISYSRLVHTVVRRLPIEAPTNKRKKKEDLPTHEVLEIYYKLEPKAVHSIKVDGVEWFTDRYGIYTLEGDNIHAIQAELTKRMENHSPGVVDYMDHLKPVLAEFIEGLSNKEIRELTGLNSYVIMNWMKG